MAFDLKQLIREHQGRELDLLRETMNPRFAKVLSTIGFDPVYVRGQGAHLWDKDGNDYLDMLSGYGVFNVGRNHPKVKDAIRQYLEVDSPNLIKMGTQLLAGVLAERLLKIAPRGLDTVFFCNSGAEAIEGAMKFARAYTGRTRMIFCQHGFHGLSMGALSVNGLDEFRHGFGPLMPWTRIPFGDAKALEAELKRGDVAAFVVEPIQGHGVFIAPDGYLQEAKALCQKHGAVLIADEVQTGFGRTGKMFASEHWGLEPDIMTISKALSGGYCPTGAILFRRPIYEKVFSSLDRCIVHSSTFSQNDLAAVCGLATLAVLEEERIVEHAAETGQYLLQQLQGLVGRYELLKEVRGKGLVIAIEFGPPRSMSLRAGWTMIHKLNQDLFCQAILVPLMMDHKILAQVAAHGMDVIKLIPPLVLTRADCDRFLASFEAVLEAAHKFPGPLWEVGSRIAKNAVLS
ncbi:MAG: aspartate aminotransferase family protein [Planctomycetota bacterium]|nr:aspartate aminotransferase family protein [Planctomycetota bacterium]